MENLEQFCFIPVFFPLLLFIFIVQRTWKKSKPNSSSPMLAPGPMKLPIIGSMHQLLGSLPHHRLRDLAKKYGPIMHLQLGQVSNIVISSPEAAKEVMKTHDITFAQRPFLPAASIFMYNFKDIAFAPYGDSWRQLRKICTMELLSTRRVQSFRSIREEEVSYLIRSISSSEGSPVNLSRMAFALSNTIIFRTAFGTLREQQNQDAFLPLVQKILEMLEGFSVADIFPSLAFLHRISGMRSKLQKVHQEADLILENIISEHREKKAGDSKGEEDDIVTVLLNLQDHGDLEFPLTTDSIKAVMLDLFLAGSETSSTAIEWAMSEMIKNSRVMEKAQAEVRQVFNEKEKIDETRFHELKYLKLVVKETLRLHPPAPLLLPRECREAVEISGYEIPINTKVIVNAWAIGRDPNCWIDAERFYPERFIDNSIDFKGKDFEFIPFGAGRRICPGIAYGMAVLELSLANLLYHFDWKLPNAMGPHHLDMSESYGVTARRKIGLCLIPIPYHPC
ncbi:hypothetical protein P3X46_006717 [Hevea brasiliensis]|uniref:Cytochrome P450 n=1 Tax=Hevea brasiliensis TaxID=3981 RepID=A0ABQ9MSW2_HEVBR|nr:premnaspirodiene oxygenase-like [Hevea brasiliensis]KAJ9182760.1 hypothetical protein P3X46_006717 [Hevea brasiliensis]